MELLWEYKFTLPGLLLLLCCSAFFSGSETALFSLSREKIAQTRARSDRVSRAIAKLVDNPSNLLVTLLFGNLAVNILFFSFSSAIADRLGKLYGDACQAIVGLIVSVVLILCGEVMPKAAGVNFSARLSRLVALPLLVWERVATPFRVVLMKLANLLGPSGHHVESAHLTADELKMLLDMSQKEGKLALSTGETIEAIMSLSRLNAKALMTPRVDLVQCPADMPAREARRLAVTRELSALPVYRESEECPIGVITLRDLYLNAGPDEPVETYTRPIKFIPGTKKVGDLLAEMVREKWLMALVVDEYGGLSGAVTVNDILEEIVGETRQGMEGAEAPPVAILEDGRYRIDAALPVNAWSDYFAIELPEDVFAEYHVVTIGGLVTCLLGRLPKKDDTVMIDNMRFTVETMGRRRAETFLLELT